MRMRLSTQRASLLNGDSIELESKRPERTDGDEVTCKCFFITHRIPIRNSAVGETDEVIMTEVICLKIHSVQETFSEHEKLA